MNIQYNLSLNIAAPPPPHQPPVRRVMNDYEINVYVIQLFNYWYSHSQQMGLNPEVPDPHKSCKKVSLPRPPLLPLSHSHTIATTSRRPLKNTFFGGCRRLSSTKDDNLPQAPPSTPKKVVVRSRRLVVAIVWLWLHGAEAAGVKNAHWQSEWIGLSISNMASRSVFFRVNF